jgi:hypothetical protein
LRKKRARMGHPALEQFPRLFGEAGRAVNKWDVLKMKIRVSAA